MKATTLIILFLVSTKLLAVGFGIGVGSHPGIENPAPDEVRWLEGDKRRFLTIYRENTGKVYKGAVILVHDQQTNPDWPDVIHPLRTGLGLYGWDTLSIAIPSLLGSSSSNAVQSRFDEAEKRINRAIEEFNGTDLPALYIIGHGWGALVSSYYLSNNQDKQITGLVMIGLREPFGLVENQHVKSLLAKIELNKEAEKVVTPLFPVLDIYGSLDRPSERYAEKRLENLGKLEQLQYQQVEIEGASHGFSHQSDELLNRVRGWMQKQSKSAD